MWIDMCLGVYGRFDRDEVYALLAAACTPAQWLLHNTKHLPMLLCLKTQRGPYGDRRIAEACFHQAHVGAYARSCCQIVCPYEPAHAVVTSCKLAIADPVHHCR